MRRKNTAFRILFLAPALVLYVVFVVYAFISTVRFSFYNWSGLGPLRNFVGFENFVYSLSSSGIGKQVLNAIGNNIEIFLMLQTVITIVGVGVAYLLTVVRERVARFLQVIYFVPMVIPSVVVGYQWGMYLTPNKGALSRIMGALGLGRWERPWLGEAGTALVAITMITAWAITGYYVFIFVPAMNAIPNDLVEAARIDGASNARTFWKIIVPLIMPTYITATALIFIAAFGAFDFIYVLAGTGGYPQGSTDVLGILAYRWAFGSSVGGGNHVLSLAATISVIGFGIVFLASAILVALQRRVARSL
jgi:raffinose/stachyose/melibiose transport system permease protein